MTRMVEQGQAFLLRDVCFVVVCQQPRIKHIEVYSSPVLCRGIRPGVLRFEPTHHITAHNTPNEPRTRSTISEHHTGKKSKAFTFIQYIKKLPLFQT